MTNTSSHPAREQPGYVYVLLTSYADSAGFPLVKIGCTSRTPDQRNRELSRGGPVGMRLVGAVTTRNMVALERKAHSAFGSSRFLANGGTEYFAVNPDDVLAWLRAEAPRVEIESARNSAWHEYIESRPWKAQSRLMMFGFGGFMLLWWTGSIWELTKHNYGMAIAMPFIAAAILGGVWYVLKRVLLPNIEAELNSVRAALEEKYHLPPGLLLKGPTSAYAITRSKRRR